MADGDRDDSEGFLPKSKRIKVDLLEERTARSKVQKTDWSLCLFCQRVKHKGVKTLLNVASFEASKVILDAARECGDHYMLVNIDGVDLIASEAKYHSACSANYVSKSNLKYHSYKEENEGKECIYSAEFETFIQGITSGLSKGIVYDMSFLLDGYREALKVKGITSSSNYQSSKLKKRIINYFSDKIVFQKQSDPTKPELVYSSDLSIVGIVQTSTLSTAEVDYVDNRQDVELDKKNILYHAAQIIKNDIKNCTGISIKPLRADEVSIESARKLIPETLRSFLSDVISGPKKRRSHDLDVSSISDTEKDRRVLMLGQDIIHAASNSQVKTPKHIGLAVTVHLTGSKEIVTLLNRMGHCSSYDVEIVNTAWARETAARSKKSGVVIPSNISPGSFVQFAADNNDLNEETLDGKQTTHATTMVVYQRQQYEHKLLPKIYADHSSRRKTLEQPVQSQIIHECSVRGKRPTVTSYAGKESYFMSEESEKSMKELAWFLLRLNRKDVLKSDNNTEGQSVPGWSAFNEEMSTVNVPRTIIGYCPMIASSPTEYSTIYTVLKTVQEMSKQLGQSTAVVTFDLAIYSKAKEVQWHYPEEFQELIIHLGGFHIALNFLALIGKKFQESGIEDVLIESGVYGSSSTQALLQRKSYNCGMQAHKLLMEALMRLQWDAFCSWVAKGGGVSCSQGEEIPSGEEEQLNINLVNSTL